MSTVDTVNGPVALEAIGRTLTHEHIFTKNPEIEEGWPDPEWEGEDAMVAKAVDTLDELKTLGIETIIDLTVPGLGRSIPRIQRVAAATAVNIVVATGYYTFNALPTFFQTHGPGLMVDMDDPMPAMFIRDLTTGIGDTGVKAVMIKVATDEPGLTPGVERVMGAAATAHLETGATITTHTHAREFRGRDQQEFFRSRGVPLEHVLIGHSGDSTDLDYLRELMDNGSTLGMDRFGMVSMRSDSERVDTVVRLVELGYAEKLTLSHDAGVFSINTPPSFRRRESPDWNHAHISRDILPQLRERGVSDADIDQMMITNAARILVGAR
ncbi:phosphotriesterase-related protein [Nakamurella flavida]|uniref:Phosphotriesterase-related protein n=1 Tax=Nakamurella flavida TaxID=363630 RepID=A0A938YNS9_9ACTN|nr:phosphotriesterase-related protein [Nakamurella flavida]MBM9476453.1 phosphotriesterase-related protein [Nakamurella flavida]MDP9779446.1 phosphotriesterase-related protein [Nakamurella flavida]